MSEALHEHDVRIWLLSPEQVTDAAQLARCAEMLSPEERVSWQRFHFERDRHTYLVSHAMTRAVLSRYAALRPEDWRFVRNEYGRPEVTNHTGLRFNLSHTKGLVAVLVTPTADAGVDVETRKRTNDLRAIADRFFSPVEVASLLPLPDEGLRHRFFELWTLKESYIKGRGKGLAIPLDKFSFSFEGGLSLQVDPSQHDDGAAWTIGLASPTPDHQLAWAVRDRFCDVNVEWLPLGDLTR